MEGSSVAAPYAGMTVEQLEQKTRQEIENLPGEHRERIVPLFDALVTRAKGQSAGDETPGGNWGST